MYRRRQVHAHANPPMSTNFLLTWLDNCSVNRSGFFKTKQKGTFRMKQGSKWKGLLRKSYDSSWANMGTIISI